MFRALLAYRARVAWSQLDPGDYGYVLDQLAPSFAGDHALGGERRSREAQLAWFQRLFRFLPGVEFILDDVLVRGCPRRTRAVPLLHVRATVAGRPYENEFVQTLDLRWHRITRIHNLEETQKLAAALEWLSAAGVDEARATPPTSDHEPRVSGSEQQRVAR